MARILPALRLSLVAVALAIACERGPARPASSEPIAATSASPKPAVQSVSTKPPEQRSNPSVAAATQPVAMTTKPQFSKSTEEMSPREMYVAYCSACHTLELVESQRLDRTTWEWVMDDVINKYGGTWITAKERAVLVDYLVENFGPERSAGP